MISANTRQSQQPPLQAGAPLTPAGGIFPFVADHHMSMPMVNNGHIVKVGFGQEFAGKVPPMDSESAKMLIA